MRISARRETDSTQLGQGFTLLELIAVLVIIGVLMVFSPSGLNALLPGKQLESEISRLGTLIGTLSAQSSLKVAAHALHLDTDNHRYAIQLPDKVIQDQVEDDEEPREALVLDPDPDFEALDWVQLPDGIKLELYEGRRRISGRFMISFSPTGTVPPHTIVMESERVPSLEEEDRVRTLKVNFPGFVTYAVGRYLEDFKLSEAELGR